MRRFIFTTFAVVLYFGSLSAQSAFTEGNIVVCRLGDGTTTPDSLNNTVWLDEYNVTTTPATLIQSIPVKSGLDTLKYGALQTYGGFLSRSSDSLYLTFSGFVDNSPTIAIVDGSVNIDLTTQYDTSYGTIRSAASLNGDSIWFATAGDEYGSVYFTERGTDSAINLLTTTDYQFNSIKIYDGQLYFYNENNYTIDWVNYTVSGSKSSLVKSTTALPTTTTTFTSVKSTNDYSSSFGTDFMMTENNVTYLADLSSSYGLVKFKDGSTTKVGKVGTGDGEYYGLTEYSDDGEGTIVFYATRKNNDDSYSILRITDIGGYTAAPSATVDTVVTVSSGAVLRGLALAPKGGVDKLEQTISNFNDTTATGGDADIEIQATATSGEEILYYSADTSVATVNDNTITLTGAGQTEIIAWQAGTAIYKEIYDTITLTVFPEDITETAAFTEGNIVVCRLGDGTTTPDSLNNTVWLDEYNVTTTPATLIQSIPVKSGLDTLKYGALQTYGGFLSRSSDSLYLTFSGFVDNSPTIAIVDGSVNIDLTTQYDTSYGTIRSAASLNGDSIWFATASDEYGSVYFTERGTDSAINLLTTTDYQFNSIKIYDGQLYFYNENNYTIDWVNYTVSGSKSSLVKSTTALPTTTTTFTSVKSTNDYSSSFGTDFMMTENNVTYLADLSSSYGLVKFKDGSTTKVGKVGTGDGEYYGLTEYSDDGEGTIVFYATRKNNDDSYSILRITDIGGYTAAPSATVDTVVTVFSEAVLRGLALAPKGGVDKLEQTISSLEILNLTDESADTVLDVTSDQGIELIYASLDNSVVSLDGSTVHVEGLGTTQIIVFNLGNDTYKNIIDTITVIVNESSLPEQTISNFDAVTVVYGETVTLAATAPGGDITYKSGDTEIVTVTGSTLAAVGVGTVLLTASQDGGGIYQSTDSTVSVTVIKADRTFSDFSDITATYKDSDTTLAVTVTGEDEIVYSSSNTDVVTVNDEGVVHFSGAGTGYIIAYVDESDNYNEAADSIMVTVAKASQTISNFEDIIKTYGDGNFALEAMASSGLDITYDAADESVAVLGGTTVKIMGAGTTTITASQEGNDNYEAAADVVITLTVNKAAQTISGTFEDITATYGDEDIVLSASAPGDVTYSIADESVAFVSGTTLTIEGAGTTTITVTATDDNYETADSTITLTVNKAIPELDLGESGDTIIKSVGDDSFELSVSSNSDGDITYSVSDESIATVSGSTVTIAGAGTTTITVTYAGNDNYEAADTTIVLTVILDNTAINSKESDLFKLYPNPVINDELHLIYESTEAVRAKIYTVQGMLVGVYMLESDTKETVLSLSHLKAGEYFIIPEGNNWIGRFIKK